MSLKAFCKTLTEEKQFELAIRLVKMGLAAWNAFTEKNSLTYTDSVVALHHNVDSNILSDTIADVETFVRALNTETATAFNKQLLIRLEQFSDPIVAIQDDDWELPHAAEKIFYAVYNLLQAAIGNTEPAFDEPVISVSINQAVDSIESAGILTEDQIEKVLRESE